MSQAICSFPGCENLRKAKTLCISHYQQAHAGRELRPLQERDYAKRFWSKVDKSGACWLWLHAKDQWGYGKVWKQGRMHPTHRVAYELVVGPIPEGLVLDHLCRNPACVNPAHLDPVTQGENVSRTLAPTALNAAKTHCERGHELSGDNLTHPRQGRPERRCRECHNLRERERQRRAASELRG